MRQVRFGGRAHHVDFGRQRAQRIDGAPGIPNHLFLTLGGLRDLQRRFVGPDHRTAQAFELADVGIHLLLAFGHGLQQALALVAHQGDVAGARLDAALELRRGLFHARDFGQRAGASFDEAGMGGPCLARLPAQRLCRVARGRKEALGFR
jgi:hypothetical protein